MLNYLIEKDKELFIFLNNLGTPAWDEFWLLVSDKYTFIPLYILLVILTFWKLGIKKTFLILLVVVALVTTTDQTSNLFKDAFERLRPCHDETISHLVRLVKHKCGGLYTFFSAHAANTMGVAVFFTILLKPYFKFLGILLISWAILVAYSRVYIGVHFPLDIIAGACFGAYFGFLYRRLAKWLTKKIVA